LKFLADECCDTGLVASLRKDGHNVLYITEEKAGAIDDEILSNAYKEERILITEDKDFGELVYRFKKPTHGIVLLRIDVIDVGEQTYQAERFINMPGVVQDTLRHCCTWKGAEV